MQSRAGRAHDFSKALHNSRLFRLNGEPGCPEDRHHHHNGDEDKNRNTFKLL
jgi:hypothetical protein